MRSVFPMGRGFVCKLDESVVIFEEMCQIVEIPGWCLRASFL